MTTVCPQRIIKEAIRLLEQAPFTNDTDTEAKENNLIELESLQRALYKEGIHKIKAAQHPF
jgi:hypothetical protein